MTVTQLVQMMSDLASFDLDNFSMSAAGTITDANAVAQLNKAQTRISLRIGMFDHSVVTTLVDGTARYLATNTNVFAKGIIKPTYVVINGNPLLRADRTDFGMWTVSEYQREVNAFRSVTATTGVPRLAAWDGTNITLYPTPNAAVVSTGNNYVAGTIFAADLSSSAMSATPDLPTKLHEALAVKATVWGALATTSQSEGWKRLQALDADAEEAIQEAAKEYKSARQDWGTTCGYNIPDRMYI